MRRNVDTGERTYGNDYYQDMMLWSLTAALDGDDFGSPDEAGRLGGPNAQGDAGLTGHSRRQHAKARFGS